MKAFLTILAWATIQASAASAQVELFPKTDATDVNPDTRLRLTFSSPPPLGNQGKIKIFDAADDSLVDELDLSIPPGPRNTRTPAPYDTLKYSSIPDTVFTVSNPDTDPTHVYQKNYVGGTSESDARHFFPVLIDQNVATIFPHNNRLAYGKTYYVQIEPVAFPFPGDGFQGITGKTAWKFSTKKAAPPASASVLVVSADGTADFSTVQGAIDYLPSNSQAAKEIFIRNGIYEEIVVLRSKQNLTVRGEDRSKVIVRYANNGVFNATGRYEFTVSGATAVNLVNFTIQVVGKDENPAQAEALLVRGDKYQTHNMTLLGSGDALQIQTNTRIYLSRTSIRGYGDNLLSYGAAFFKECELISTYGPHGWPRNPQSNHGDVFVNTTFRLEGKGTSGDGHCTLARSPTTGGTNFPFAEFVLIDCKLQGIAPEGWGAVGPDTSNVKFWEYNSVNLSDGTPVDVSKRAPWSRQLTMEKDAETIANYRNPTWVLGGWTPELAPLILTRLADSITLPAGESAELSVEVAAEPVPTYQWFKDGQPIAGAMDARLKVDAAGEYSVRVENSVGKVESNKASVTVGGQGAQPGTAGAQATAGAGAAGTGGSATSAGAGAPAGGTSTAAGNAAPVAAGTSAMSRAGAGAVVAPAPAPSAGAAPRDEAARRSSGGCSVGREGAAPGAWQLLLALLAALRVAALSTPRRP